jgi:HEAT repeat protein
VSPEGRDPAPQGPAARRRLAALAGHLGDETAARRHLGDLDPTVRASALGALERIGVLDPEDLRAAWRDPSPEVRSRAAELCVSVAKADGSVSTLSDLTTGLTDRDWRVVEASCFALGELGELVGHDAGAVEALSAVARSHGDPLCREAAVAAIGSIGSPAGLGAILDATHDKPAVRRRAVLALAPFEGPAVDEALQRALEDRDWQVRQAAEDLSGRHLAEGPSTS